MISKYKYNNSYSVNAPVKDKNCYDASILVNKNLTESKEICKQVLLSIDAKVEKETDKTILVQRNRHIGVFVGSGGEEILATLDSINPSQTFITIATKTGFVGGAGQKPWSCKVIDEIYKIVSE